MPPGVSFRPPLTVPRLIDHVSPTISVLARERHPSLSAARPITGGGSSGARFGVLVKFSVKREHSYPVRGPALSRLP